MPTGNSVEFAGTTNINQALTTLTVNNNAGNSSNLLPAMTISGQVTGNQSWFKAGTGVLYLTNNTNNFTGNITVTGGVLAFNSDGALGNTGNAINLSGTTATLRATGETGATTATGGDRTRRSLRTSPPRGRSTSTTTPRTTT